jgi:MFS family permease
VSFFIYKQTASNTAVSFALLSFLIPSFISSILAGVIVERMGKRWVLIMANLLRAGIVFLMFFMEKNIGFLYLFIGLLALTTQFFTPAESSIIPRIVPQNKLISANAYFSITIYLTLILGFLISPFAFKFFGYKTVFIIFFIYILSAVVLYFLRLNEPVFYTNFKQPFKHLMRKFKDTFMYTFVNFWTNKNVNKNVFSVIIVQVVLFVLIALAPGFADKILRIPVEDLSFLIVFPTAIGFLISSLLISRMHVKRSEQYTNYSFLALAITFSTIFITSQFKSRELFNIINFGLLALVGFFSGVIIILAYSNLQKDDLGQGRAGYFGLLNAFVTLASVLPVLLSGFLSDFFGVDKILLVVALSFFAISYSVFRKAK